MPIDPIMAKIEKLLAYANSTTAADADAFLAKAHALMAEHNLCVSDISDIEHATIQSLSSISCMKVYEEQLVGGIAQIFKCLIIWEPRATSRGAAFILVGHRCQLATAVYAATVLLRRMRRARSKFVREHNGCLTKAADSFTLGWAMEAVKQARHLSNDHQNDPELIAYAEKHISGLSGFANSPKLDIDRWAFGAGKIAGSQETVHRPMAGETQLRLK